MKKLILICLILNTLFVSCSKKIDQVTVEEKTKTIKLKRYGSEKDGFREYTYNGDQMVQEKFTGNVSNSPSLSTYSYHSSGKLKDIRVDYFGKRANIREEFIFENDKVIRSNLFNEATNELLSYYLREYPAGKVIYKSFSKLDVLTQKNEYILTPDGKNYTIMKSFLGETLSYTTNILKMDDKKNPSKLLSKGSSVFTSTNNALNVDFIFPNPASNQSSQLTLEYNEFGYPTKETNQNGVVTRIFEYIIE